MTISRALTAAVSCALRVVVPPVQARAIHRCLTFLAAGLGVPRGDVRLGAGVRFREMTVRVTHVDNATVKARLDAELGWIRPL